MNKTIDIIKIYNIPQLKNCNIDMKSVCEIEVLSKKKMCVESKPLLITLICTLRYVVINYNRFKNNLQLLQKNKDVNLFFNAICNIEICCILLAKAMKLVSELRKIKPLKLTNTLQYKHKSIRRLRNTVLHVDDGNYGGLIHKKGNLICPHLHRKYIEYTWVHRESKIEKISKFSYSELANIINNISEIVIEILAGWRYTPNEKHTKQNIQCNRPIVS